MWTTSFSCAFLMTGNVKTLVGRVGQTPKVLKRQKYCLCFARNHLLIQSRVFFFNFPSDTGLSRPMPDENHLRVQSCQSKRSHYSTWRSIRGCAKQRQYFCSFNTLGVCLTQPTSVLTCPVMVLDFLDWLRVSRVSINCIRDCLPILRSSDSTLDYLDFSTSQVLKAFHACVSEKLSKASSSCPALNSLCEQVLSSMNSLLSPKNHELLSDSLPARDLAFSLGRIYIGMLSYYPSLLLLLFLHHLYD